MAPGSPWAFHAAEGAEKIFLRHFFFHEKDVLLFSRSPDTYLNSFHSSFAEELLHLDIDLHIASVATNREQEQQQFTPMQ